MWPEWSKSSFFALFTHREVQQPRQKPIQGLAAGDGCPGICANHINCDFKSEFHPFHLSSVIQGPIQWVALLKSAHLWFHLYEGADFCSTGGETGSILNYCPKELRLNWRKTSQKLSNNKHRRHQNIYFLFSAFWSRPRSGGQWIFRDRQALPQSVHLRALRAATIA